MDCTGYKEDEHFVRDIRTGGAVGDQAIACLYRRFRQDVLTMVRSFIRYRSGMEDDASDAVQDAFLVMIDKIRDGGYNEGSLVHFWAGITKGILKNKLKRDARTDLTDDYQKFDDIDDISPEALLIDEEKKELLDGLLGKLGKRCRDVLLLWAGGYSMDEIAERLGLSSEAMARKTKYKCKNQLMDLIADVNPEHWTD